MGSRKKLAVEVRQRLLERICSPVSPIRWVNRDVMRKKELFEMFARGYEEITVAPLTNKLDGAFIRGKRRRVVWLLPNNRNDGNLEIAFDTLRKRHEIGGTADSTSVGTWR